MSNIIQEAIYMFIRGSGEREIEYNDDFIMSPKIDFAFKLIFGNENHKEVLRAFLSAALNMPEEEFYHINLLNTELLKEFREDKKGILDVRVETKNKEQIDIEIQILPTKFMAERTLFYWSKMYNGQVEPGYTYDKLKKCITINIVNFDVVPLEKIHTKFHILEDETHYKLTDVLEIHFLELSKVKELSDSKEEPIEQWLKFINADSREGMEMLAQQNENIKTAYEILERASRTKAARLAYEAREAEIMDQLTREKTAKEEGIEEGIQKGMQQGIQKGIQQEKIEIAKKLIGLLEDEIIAEKTGLSTEEIRKLK